MIIKPAIYYFTIIFKYNVIFLKKQSELNWIIFYDYNIYCNGRRNIILKSGTILKLISIDN